MEVKGCLGETLRFVAAFVSSQRREVVAWPAVAVMARRVSRDATPEKNESAAC